MADMEWLLHRSREVERELAVLPAWERASLQAQLRELGKPREHRETEPTAEQKTVQSVSVS